MFEVIRDDIVKTGANVFRIALYQDGEWREETLRPACSCLNCYSLSKNFTATAVGIAADMGLLAVDDPIVKFFPGEVPGEADEKLARVRIRHLLTQTMGCSTGFLFENDRYAHPTDDWVRLCLSKPLEYEPGARFVYSNSTFYLLSALIRRVSGMTADMFLREHLFRHMGIQSVAWERCPRGEAMGATGLYMTTRDILKLGVLYLNGGEYEGRRLLSKEFADEAVMPQVTSDGGQRYGYSFWIDEIGYYGSGAANQIIYVVPERNIVFAAHAFIDGLYDFIGILKNRL